MKINEQELRAIVSAVVSHLQEQAPTPTSPQSQPASKNNLVKGHYLSLTEGADAPKGITSDEVVIGISVGFLTHQTTTITELDLEKVLREIIAGIEEEGVKYRVIRMLRTIDVAFIGHEAAKLIGAPPG